MWLEEARTVLFTEDQGGVQAVKSTYSRQGDVLPFLAPSNICMLKCLTFLSALEG